jgi:hypothetical protein
MGSASLTVVRSAVAAKAAPLAVSCQLSTRAVHLSVPTWPAKQPAGRLLSSTQAPQHGACTLGQWTSRVSGFENKNFTAFIDVHYLSTALPDHPEIPGSDLPPSPELPTPAVPGARAAAASREPSEFPETSDGPFYRPVASENVIQDISVPPGAPGGPAAPPEMPPQSPPEMPPTTPPQAPPERENTPPDVFPPSPGPSPGREFPGPSPPPGGPGIPGAPEMPPGGPTPMPGPTPGGPTMMAESPTSSAASARHGTARYQVPPGGLPQIDPVSRKPLKAPVWK